MAVGEVDGEPAIITLHHGADAWTPRSVVRLEFADRHIVRIVDYTHALYI